MQLDILESGERETFKAAVHGVALALTIGTPPASARTSGSAAASKPSRASPTSGPGTA